MAHEVACLETRAKEVDIPRPWVPRIKLKYEEPFAASIKTSSRLAGVRFNTRSYEGQSTLEGTERKTPR